MPSGGCHVADLMLLDDALTPYNAGTSSGWSGSDTSRQRASAADSGGTTKDRQNRTLALVSAKGPFGITWHELAEITGWHHGTASGVLSVLHKEGQICRLKMKRDKCKVYVMPFDVWGREIEPHGRKPHPCPNCGYEG